MSDIDDLLTEFGSAKTGYDRYMPDPAEAMATYTGMAQGGWDSIKQGASQLGQFGSDPLSRIKGVGNIALGGAQWAGAIPGAVGKYFGGPIGRGVEDATGSPTAGHIVGGTAELAPALMVPFPGANAIKAGPQAAGMVAGELPAARMATEGLLTKFGARGASAASTSGDELEDLADEIAGKTRMTSAAKDIDYRTALDAYLKMLDDMGGKGGMPELPPSAAPAPRDIRLLHKGSPKVGERKYAQDEAGQPVVMKGYADQGGTPTVRTSHSPRMPQEAEAPVDQYENIFRREMTGEPHISQMPLAPGTRPEVLNDMWLPNVRENAPVDPRLLAELKLKFGGGSPQGASDNPPWMPQQTAGQRPPAQMPIYGARPAPERKTNVMIPDAPAPISMGKEARHNIGRLINDLDLPPDPTQALQRGRTARQEHLARQPEAPPPELTPAQAPKAVTQYGNIEVGQPYDIVMKMNGQEMRSSGGTVKELLYKDEPVVESGKSVMRPVGYAVLEDGRQVPTKLLQRSGTAQPNIQMSAPATEAMPKPAKASTPPVASGEQAADPAFAAVQKNMAAKSAPAKADRSPMVKAIFDAREKYGSQTTYAQVREFAPDASRAQLDKAMKEAQKTHPRLSTKTGADGEPVIYMKKLSASESAKASDTAKAEHFDRAIGKVFGKKKTAYLHELDPYDIGRRHEVDLSESTVVKRVNEMIKEGKMKIYPEGTPDKPLTKITKRHIKERDTFDEDFIVEYTKGKK